MKKAVLVSFFKSNNLGDLALSSAIEHLISDKGYNIIKYDFPSMTRIQDNTIKTPVYVQESNPAGKKSILRTMLRKIRKALFFLFGEVKIVRLWYYFENLLNFEKRKVINQDMKTTDILVIGGGNMVMDIIPSWPIIFKYYCLLAKKYKKDVYIVYIGAGPINYKQSKEIYSQMFKQAKKITVRDPLSREVCAELISNRHILETIDPVFSLPVNLLEYRISNIKVQKEDSKLKIGICILGISCFNTQHIYESYVEGLLKLIKRLSLLLSGKVEFILFSTETTDYIAVYELKNKLGSAFLKDASIIHLNQVDEVISLFKELNFLIGGRMHSLIFAQICLLPFIGVVWQSKIKGFGYVTKSNHRIYEIGSLNMNIDLICDEIIESLSNLELIRDMSETNKVLNKKVQEGNVVQAYINEIKGIL